jgi:hypothetical protein
VNGSMYPTRDPYDFGSKVVDQGPCEEIAINSTGDPFLDVIHVELRKFEKAAEQCSKIAADAEQRAHQARRDYEQANDRLTGVKLAIDAYRQVMSGGER